MISTKAVFAPEAKGIVFLNKDDNVTKLDDDPMKSACRSGQYFLREGRRRHYKL